ncbi:hypothetical protein CCOS865_05068 [Pseudomonas reidholzensis]|uniref:Uncharacterized protein n=1 Tax=Pseudomonas reidholzensis TaxID=1785162 RepID=A0A383S238_9PSED|nr:hypothetical protein [Pseudomonas reidholzensis]SYX92776.1 hypothetical protein CCOS865_05068 [Pseudomonas reidholzensis]
MKTADWSLWLVGGAALLVANEVAGPRQYVLDSILYAQLRAVKRVGPRFPNYGRWYSEYRRALEERGWIVTRSNSDHEARSEGRPPTPEFTSHSGLLARHPALSGLLGAASARLMLEDAQQHLRSFNLAGIDQASVAVHELGVVLPDCSLALSGLACSEDGIDLRESDAVLSEHLTEAVQQQVHGLLESKHLAVHIRSLGGLDARREHAKS